MGVRATYLTLVAVTIAVGLFVHVKGTMLGPTAKDVLADALWAVMLVWWLGAGAPRTSLATRATAALAICFAVEASQLIHTAVLDAVRQTLIGHLVLGSGFDPRDLVSYTAGVAAAATLERVAVTRKPVAGRVIGS